MGNRVTSIPAPGIRSLNDVVGNGQNINLTSSDSSITITADNTAKTVDLVVASGGSSAGTVIENVTCDVSVYVGAAIRMSSGVAVNAQADSEANSNVLGFVESKPSSTLANVRLVGKSEAVFAGLDETKEYYLSDSVAGGITDTPPVGSGKVVLKVGQPFTSTEFVVLKGKRTVRA